MNNNNKKNVSLLIGFEELNLNLSANNKTPFKSGLPNSGTAALILQFMRINQIFYIIYIIYNGMEDSKGLSIPVSIMSVSNQIPDALL